MKVVGSIYAGREGRKYLALYNFFPDIYRAPPPSLNNSSNIAHVAFTAGKISRGIDIFPINKNHSNLQKEIHLKRTVQYSGQEKLNYVDKKHDIKYEILRDIKGSKEEEDLLYVIRKDIRDFCRNEAKKITGTSIKYVNAMTPEIEIRKIKQKSILRGGKQEFVPSCSLEANLDFSWGCVSGFVNGFLDVFAECKYCYSLYQHKTFSKFVLDLDKKQLKKELLGEHSINNNDKGMYGRPINVLRLGKRTESGSRFTLDSLVATLETCTETDTRVVMPTKYLAFDKEIARLFKRTNSSMLYGIGFDKLERGACSHGCNNAFRLEQARLYRKQGVNSILYLLVDLPHAPGKRELEVLRFSRENNIPAQLLPIRLTSKDIAQEITGMSWESLKGREDKQLLIKGFSKESREKTGGYKYVGSGMMSAQEKDQFWLDLVGDNKGFVRMCHHDEEETYCGRCFLNDNGLIIPTEPVKINYQKPRKGNYKWNSKKKKYELKKEVDLFSIKNEK